MTAVAPSPRWRITALYSAWISYGLLALSLMTAGILAATPPLLLAFILLPLLIFLPGMYRRSPRSFAYLCFVALIYFTVIVTNVFKPDRSLADITALVAVVILFVAAMLFARWQRAEMARGRLVSTESPASIFEDQSSP